MATMTYYVALAFKRSEEGGDIVASDPKGGAERRAGDSGGRLTARMEGHCGDCRAQRRPLGRQAHRGSRWHPFGRRHRGGRRRSHGRWSEHRGAAAGGKRRLAEKRSIESHRAPRWSIDASPATDASPGSALNAHMRETTPYLSDLRPGSIPRESSPQPQGITEKQQTPATSARLFRQPTSRRSQLIGRRPSGRRQVANLCRRTALFQGGIVGIPVGAAAIDRSPSVIWTRPSIRILMIENYR
jgi:hypothetical protein